MIVINLNVKEEIQELIRIINSKGEVASKERKFIRICDGAMTIRNVQEVENKGDLQNKEKEVGVEMHEKQSVEVKDRDDSEGKGSLRGAVEKVDEEEKEEQELREQIDKIRVVLLAGDEDTISADASNVRCDETGYYVSRN